MKKALKLKKRQIFILGDLSLNSINLDEVPIPKLKTKYFPGLLTPVFKQGCLK